MSEEINLNLYEQLSAERKQLQREGRIPPWYLTGSWQLFKSKYLYQATDVRTQFRRIAKAAAAHLIDISVDVVQQAEKKFFDMMWEGHLSMSTPVLSNMGTDRALPVSCQGTYFGDSIDDFYMRKHELAMHTKHGFGTSGYLGDIRPRGTPIHGGGKAEGIYPVFKGIVDDMQYVSQGSTRRGSFAGYLPITHGDFDELVDWCHGTPDDVNIGWNVHNPFIKDLEAGHPESVRRFQRSMRLKMITGRGYYFFPDKVNKRLPEAFVKAGLTVKASNLCFTGDTMVAVADGRNAVPIKELAESGEEFLVYSGDKANEGSPSQWKGVTRRAKARMTGRRNMVRVFLSNWDYFDCTPDHRLATTTYGEWVEAADSEGKELSTSSLSLLQNGEPLDAESSGFQVVAVHPHYGEYACYDVTILDEGLNDNQHSFYILPPSTDPDPETYAILVHNCTEIMLPSDMMYTFICVLSSANLLHWDAIKASDDIFWMTVFLDCVNSNFIRRARKLPGFERSVRFAEDFGALGLGVCGWHTLLQSKGIPFESLEAHLLNNEIFEHMDKESRRASTWLYDKLGPRKWTRGTEMRNATRLAIAPTKSSALLMGGVSESTGPDPAMTYTQASAGGEMLRVNQFILPLMRERGVYSKAVFDDLNAHKGSVQHVNWLDSREKEVFKTGFEINMEAVLRMASSRQRFLDQGQSLNLWFSADEEPEWIAHIHRMAFLDPNILSLYYIYSQRGIKAASRECVACQ